ncbi:hypothetical protein FALBO_6001, partial [Fusarium albosuccineum]
TWTSATCMSLPQASLTHKPCLAWQPAPSSSGSSDIGLTHAGVPESSLPMRLVSVALLITYMRFPRRDLRHSAATSALLRGLNVSIGTQLSNQVAALRHRLFFSWAQDRADTRKENGPENSCPILTPFHLPPRPQQLEYNGDSQIQFGINEVSNQQ